MTTTPRLWKPATQVNTTDAPPPMSGGLAFQLDGQIAPLADGGYVVAWTDLSRAYNPAGQAVAGQWYDAAGNKARGEVDISGFDEGDQLSPAIATLPNGNVAVAFVDTSLGEDIYVRIYDSSQGSVRTDFIDLTLSHAFDPSITAFADGSYVVSFTVGTGADTDIAARIVSPTGTVGAQFNIDNQDDNRNFSEIATLSNGNFVVVYQDESFGNAADTDVFYQVFSPTGTRVLGRTAVPGGFDHPGLEQDPDVAALRDGGFAVVWSDTNGSVTDVRAAILSDNDTVIAADILVNTTTAGVQDEASVVALADGGFLVTWEDDAANLVRGQRFDAAGTRIGAEFTVKNGVSPVDSPEAALLADGHIAYAVGDVSTGDPDVVTSIRDPRTLVQNFDGSEGSDFAWQHTTGQAVIWLLDDTNLAYANFVGPNPGASWHLKGDGDFNADGRSDFLGQDDNGQASVWLLDGASLLSTAQVGPSPGATWHVKASGDFDGDGNDDILWQHDSGLAVIWLLNGTNLATAAFAGPSLGASWHVIDSGDFDGDGKSDILWQHDTGQAVIWLMNGTSLVTAAFAGPNPGADWHAKASGDFNGDGKSDILWQHDSGQVVVWLMDGTTLVTAAFAGPNPGSLWHAVGTGEFNGDGKSDILWQHDNGQAAVWLLDGASVISGPLVGPSPGTDWHLVA
jgi:hypothetical protein